MFLNLNKQYYIKHTHTHKSREQSPKQDKPNPKKPTSKHIIIKIAKVKDKEAILKAATERQLPTRELP